MTSTRRSSRISERHTVDKEVAEKQPEDAVNSSKPAKSKSSGVEKRKVGRPKGNGLHHVTNNVMKKNGSYEPPLANPEPTSVGPAETSSSNSKTTYVSIILSSPSASNSKITVTQASKTLATEKVPSISSPPVIIPVAPIVAERNASSSKPDPRPEKPDILTTISSKIAAPLITAPSSSVIQFLGSTVGRPVTRTATGARTTKVTKPKKTKSKNPVGRPRTTPKTNLPVASAPEEIDKSVDQQSKSENGPNQIAKTLLKSPVAAQKVEVVSSEEVQYLGRLKSPTKQGGLAIVRMETVSGEAAKTLTFAMANMSASQDLSGTSTSAHYSSISKYVHKIAPGTSLTVRKLPSKAVPLAEVSSTSVMPVSKPASPPIVKEDSHEILKPVSPITCIKSEPVVVVPESLSVDPVPKENLDLPASIVSKSESVLIDVTIDEVIKNNPLRTVDSDSTLTASETEAIEAQLQRKKIKSESSAGNRGATPRRDKRNVENSPSSGNTENQPNSDSIRSPSGQPKQKRKESSTRKSGQKRSLDTQFAECRELGDPCRDLNKHGGFSPRRGHSPGLISDLKLESPSSNELSLRRNTIDSNDFRMMVTSVKVEPKDDPPVPKLSYSYVGKESFDESDYRNSPEYATWMSLRQKKPVEDCLTDRKMEQGAVVETPDENEKFRQRVRSVSLVSDYAMDTSQVAPGSAGSSHVIPSMTDDVDLKPKNQSRKKTGLKEGKKIGTEPLTDLGRWKPQDDMLLIMAVSEYRELALVHKQVKFSCHFTLHEVQERWFNLLYNRKVSKSACQAMRSCPPDIMSVIQRKTPFSEAEEALLAEIPMLKERPTLEIFSILLESNHHIFPSFRTTEDLEKHWRVMLADGRIDNSDTLCTIPDDQLTYNNERILPFYEMESRIKDAELKDWKHVSGEFAYEMERIQRQNRYNIMRLDKEMQHLRYLLERSLNYELPDFTRPEFIGTTDRIFLAVLLGQRAKFGIKLGKASFGRSVPGKTVDLDFSFENYAGKLSRQQGYIILERNGNFRIENHGRRPVFVDEQILYHGDFTVLSDEATIEVGDIRLQFYVNHNRVQRFLRQKYYGEWLSDDELEDTDKEKKTCKVTKKTSKVRKAPESPNISELIPAATPLNVPSSPKKTRGKSKPFPAAFSPDQTSQFNGGTSNRPIGKNLKEISQSTQESDSPKFVPEIPADTNQSRISSLVSGTSGYPMLSVPAGVVVTPSVNRISSPLTATLSRSASAPDARALLASSTRNTKIPSNRCISRTMALNSLTRAYVNPQTSALPKAGPNVSLTFARPFRLSSSQPFFSGPAIVGSAADVSKMLNGRPSADIRSAPSLDPVNVFSTVPNPEPSLDGVRRTLG